MRAILYRLVRLSAGYSLVTLAGPVLTILLTPLYTRVLSPADYGVVEAAIAVSAFVNTLVLFAMDQALNAHFFEGDETRRRDLLTTALWIVLGLGGLAFVTVAAAAEPLARLLYDDPGRRFMLIAVAIGAVTTPLHSLILAALRLGLQVRRANLLAGGLLLATATSNVVLTLGLQLKATGVITANVIGSGCAALLGLGLAAPILRGRFSTALARPLLRTAISLLPGAYSFLILSGIDRLLLTQFVSQTDLGLYSIANKLASMLLVLLSAIWYAWWPMALEMAPRPGTGRQLARMLEYLAALAMLVALAVGVFAPEILSVVTRSAYVPAAPMALALMIYTGPLGLLTQLFFVGLYVHKRTHWISAAYFAAGATNIILNLWWDPLWGAWGAVWATVVSGVLLIGLAYWLGQRTLAIPYRAGRLAVLSLVYVGEVAAFLLWPNASHWLIKLAGLSVLAATVFAVGIVTPAEVVLAWREVRQRLRALRAGQRA
jgi:O-antigen/teichoic acid export membrane protein